MAKQKVTIKQWLTDNHDRYASYDTTTAAAAIVKETGWKIRSVTDELRSFRRGSNKVKAIGTSLDAFIAAEDDESRTRRSIDLAIEQLKADQLGQVLTDAEFKSLCDRVHPQLWRSVSSEDRFSDYRFQVGTRTFWADKKTADKAVAEIAKARRA